MSSARNSKTSLAIKLRIEFHSRMKTICLPEKKFHLNPILPLPLPARLPHTPRRCSPISNIKLLPAFIYLSRKLSTESHTSSKPICLFRTPSPTSFHQPSVPFLHQPKTAPQNSQHKSPSLTATTNPPCIPQFVQFLDKPDLPRTTNPRPLSPRQSNHNRRPKVRKNAPPIHPRPPTTKIKARPQPLSPLNCPLLVPLLLTWASPSPPLTSKPSRTRFP